MRATARSVLERHWRAEGYTVPNATVYPFQWLWDSCFHAIAWAALGEPDRAVTELTHLFRTQSDDGFVPHVDYEAEPTFHAAFWGREGSSSITQPPMYGHAIAELARRGVAVPASLLSSAAAGLSFLLERRARDDETGLVTIVHPWESGADDSPRWDHWCDGGSFDTRRWYVVKGRLLEGVTRDRGGAPIANASFGSAPIAFNSLIAFNAIELATVTGDGALESRALELLAALRDRFDVERRTWVDGGPAARTSGRVRTSDALLAAFGGAHVDVALDELTDADAFGGRCGPTYVHRDEVTFAPRAYWRGAAWPQLTYLFWSCARRANHPAERRLASQLVEGAHRSGFAEYWDPDDGSPLGARPQSWTALASVVA